MKRLALLAAPWLLLALAVLPLASGARTLYLRDVLHSHYPLRVAAAEALGRGELPLVDPHRSGGQPLLGNPNALPLYPDGLLALVASPLWALDAHFWLHWLLAPFAVCWLARAWGLSRPAAWAAGIVYATSGYFLSLLNLYNLVAGAALAPALVAATLDATAPRQSPGRALAPVALAAVASGGLWALLLLAGDPLYAVLAALLAASAVAARGRPGGLGAVLAAAGLGTAVAAPQWVELLRIAPLSYRGHQRYSELAALAQSWDPRSALEWLLPMAFGTPDPTFWGRRFYGGNEPLLFSLAPGILAVGLVVAAGRPRRSSAGWSLAGWSPAGWAWGWIVAGGFLALGFHNPVLRWGIDLPGAGLLRYPVKVWLVVALAASLLAGLGWERLRADGRRRLAVFLALAAALFAAGWLALLVAPADLLARLDPARLDPAAAAEERLRWLSIAFLQLVVVGLLAAALRLFRRRRTLASALLLVVHAGSQLAFLAPLYDGDEAAPYRTPPPLLAEVDADRPLVHGGFRSLFGAVYSRMPELPDRRPLWTSRAHFEGLMPFAGAQWGLRYALAASPEGLDSFLSVALGRLFPQLDDLRRIRLLEAIGVATVLLPRELEPPAAERARLRATVPTALGPLRVYALPGAAPPAAVVGRALRAPHLDAAVAALVAPGFDPRLAVVLPEREGVPAVEGERPPGAARVVAESWETSEVEVASPAGGWLVLQRAHLPIYLATLDGRPAAIEVANVQQIAVAVPAGRHRVVVAADRRPTRVAGAVAVLGALGLLALAGRAVRGRR